MSTDSTFQYTALFGPVPSRRLGISLGVDLVPHETCSPKHPCPTGYGRLGATGWTESTEKYFSFS